jgi:hypothetical protein
MLSVEQIKKLIEGPALTDEKAEEIRDSLRYFAEIIFEKWLAEWNQKKIPALFDVRRKNGINEALDDYWSDRLEVKARCFFDAIKALKNCLYSN